VFVTGASCHPIIGGLMCALVAIRVVIVAMGATFVVVELMDTGPVATGASPLQTSLICH
jgi:uncharacterized membrane protein